MINLERWADEHPDYPECHVALIDALRRYIRCCDNTTQYLLEEGSISPEEARAESPHIARCQALLKEMEDWSVDPSCCGFLQTRNIGDRP